MNSLFNAVVLGALSVIFLQACMLKHISTGR